MKEIKMKDFLKLSRSSFCTWKEDVEGYYATKCLKKYSADWDENAQSEGFKYCPNCGKRIRYFFLGR